jgi:hypothetical protein
MLSYIAVPVGVGMRGFEDENVASIYAPSFSLSKRRKRPFVVQLSPMALAIAVSEMTLPAIRKRRIPSLAGTVELAADRYSIGRRGLHRSPRLREVLGSRRIGRGPWCHRRDGEDAAVDLCCAAWHGLGRGRGSSPSSRTLQTRTESGLEARDESASAVACATAACNAGDIGPWRSRPGRNQDMSRSDGDARLRTCVRCWHRNQPAVSSRTGSLRPPSGPGPGPCAFLCRGRFIPA